MIIRIVPATWKYKYYASTVMQNLDIQSLLTRFTRNGTICCLMLTEREKKKSPNCKLEKRGHINLMYFPFFLSFFFLLFFVYFLSTSIDAVENLAELCLKGGTPKLRSPVIVTQAFTWSPWFMNKHPTTYLGVDSSPDLLYSGFSSYVPWLVPLLL